MTRTDGSEPLSVGARQNRLERTDRTWETALQRITISWWGQGNYERSKSVEQISILQVAPDEDVEELKEQCGKFIDYSKDKRRWENGFQKWSDSQVGEQGTDGVCGYGSMCDYCEDNSYGRPCVRALNAMLRETGKSIDYKTMTYEEVWEGARA